MRQETIVYFSEKEEAFVRLLIGTGMKQTIAKTLVFLMNTGKATSREIERGTDLRQPEVSLAIKYMAGQGWVENETIPNVGLGRPNRRLSLAMPAQKILAAIEMAVRKRSEDQLAMVKRLRSFG